MYSMGPSLVVKPKISQQNIFRSSYCQFNPTAVISLLCFNPASVQAVLKLNFSKNVPHPVRISKRVII